MRRTNKIIGTITMNGAPNVWPHELFIARALANDGYDVCFIPAHTSLRSADAYVNNTVFEFKAPEGSTIKAIDRNLSKAVKQSPNVVISSIRMKNVQDRSIINHLITQLRAGKGLRRLIFVARDGKTIDINDIIG